MTLGILPLAQNFSGRQTTLKAGNSVSNVCDCLDLLRAANILGLAQSRTRVWPFKLWKCVLQVMEVQFLIHSNALNFCVWLKGWICLSKSAVTWNPYHSFGLDCFTKFYGSREKFYDFVGMWILVYMSTSLHKIGTSLTKQHGVKCCKTLIFTVTVLPFIT